MGDATEREPALGMKNSTQRSGRRKTETASVIKSAAQDDGRPRQHGCANGVLPSEPSRTLLDVQDLNGNSTHYTTHKGSFFNPFVCAKSIIIIIVKSDSNILTVEHNK